jgi:hypothetical protein
MKCFNVVLPSEIMSVDGLKFSFILFTSSRFWNLKSLIK